MKNGPWIKIITQLTDSQYITAIVGHFTVCLHWSCSLRTSWSMFCRHTGLLNSQYNSVLSYHTAPSALPACIQSLPFWQQYPPDPLDRPWCERRTQWASDQNRSCRPQNPWQQAAGGEIIIESLSKLSNVLKMSLKAWHLSRFYPVFSCGSIYNHFQHMNGDKPIECGASQYDKDYWK